jgi:hypothetical protein
VQIVLRAPSLLLSSVAAFLLQSYMEDAAQHVGADMAQRILTGGPDLAQLERGAKALPIPCACGGAPAGPLDHHHHLRATTPGPDKGAGDSDVDTPRSVDAESSLDGVTALAV